ncbi:MAG TPA: hypothetical protein VGM02_02485 [Acidobacteriaceae bacterium]|jgi:uncharacterized protein YjgD (DUF1641 family)
MAKPVAYRVFTPPDTREELKRKIDAAPAEHADAILSAYQLLEQAHESGTLELLRGALAAQDSIINHAVGMVSEPEMVNGLRNLIVLGKVLGNINQTIETAIGGDDKVKRRRSAPPSLFTLVSRMNTPDARRGIEVAAGLLAALGAAARPRKK